MTDPPISRHLLNDNMVRGAMALRPPTVARVQKIDGEPGLAAFGNCWGGPTSSRSVGKGNDGDEFRGIKYATAGIVHTLSHVGIFPGTRIVRLDA